jgi:hypothetical protein
LPAGTTVARKVSAFNVLSLRDANHVARGVEPDAISDAARLGDGTSSIVHGHLANHMVVRTRDEEVLTH